MKTMHRFFCTKDLLLVLLTWIQIKVVFGIDQSTTIPPKLLDILKKSNGSEVKDAINGTRRILGGSEARDRRPYMVYLKLAADAAQYNAYKLWLCGGVIIHEEYILTSAACIEDARHFYIVSGTWSYSPYNDQYSNTCIKNGAKKAIWKCVPRNYVFDGHENDNLRWMNNDIAIVKTEDEFDFDRRIRGCDFIPKPIRYNGDSHRLEDPDTVASVAGWGSTFKYSDWVNSRRQASETRNLLEAPVTIIHKEKCKTRWGKKYHNIIDNYMICTRDNQPELSEICNEKYAECGDMDYSVDEDARRAKHAQMRVHTAYHNESGSNSRRREAGSGGFCENDHGGPLVYGDGVNAIVIGVISACLVKERTNVCYGPFLYTSVYKNRNLIECAVLKTLSKCNKLFRSSVTHTEETLSWVDHPDGPAKNELAAMRRAKENMVTTNATLSHTSV